MVEFNKLDDIDEGTPLQDLGKGPLRDLQRAISYVGYNVGVIDGLYGPRTRNAWGEFVQDNNAGDSTVIGRQSLAALSRRISAIGDRLDATMGTKDQVKDAIGGLCEELQIGRKQQVAYVLATVDWETNHTFEPVREAYWLSETWRRNNLRYYPYYGRGYVQLTWDRNYRRYGDILGIDLIDKPDRALDARTSLFVLVQGFKTGAFTGRRLTEFVNNVETDYENARRCINGKDKWREIKSLAEAYEDEL